MSSVFGMRYLTVAFFAVFSVIMLVASPSKAEYVYIDDAEIYYEIHGEGEPVLLLHGGLSNINAWSGQISALEANYKIIAIESRGHGRSTDGDGPITYDIMTSDVIKIMNRLRIYKADVVGWSDGAIIAINLALKYPKRVKKMVLLSPNIEQGTFTPFFQYKLDHKWVFNGFADLFKRDYLRLKKDLPDKDWASEWVNFREKIYELWETDCYVPHEDGERCMDALEDISAETLILWGDVEEIVRADHIYEIYKTIPNSILVRVPLSGHDMPQSRKNAFNIWVYDFLMNGQEIIDDGGWMGTPIEW